MAIAGSGGWVPSARVSIGNKQMKLGIIHNVPKNVSKTAAEAAEILIANPRAMPYVDKTETIELWYRLYLADLVEPLSRTYEIKERIVGDE